MTDCGHNCASCSAGGDIELSKLTESEFEVLFALERYHYLPVARFALASSREDEAYSVALEPVYIVDESDSPEVVKRAGELLSGLAEKGLVSLDYDQPLGAYPYDEYRGSELFESFVSTVEEGKKREGFIFDTPVLETGSVALTCAGRRAVARLRGE